MRNAPSVSLQYHFFEYDYHPRVPFAFKDGNVLLLGFSIHDLPFEIFACLSFMVFNSFGYHELSSTSILFLWI